MRGDLEAHLVEAPGEDAAGRATSSATPSPRRMRSEYIVGWVLLLLTLAVAIAVVTGVVRIALVP